MDSYDLIEDEPLGVELPIEDMDEKRKRYHVKKAFKIVLNKKGKVSKYEMDDIFLEA